MRDLRARIERLERREMPVEAVLEDIRRYEDTRALSEHPWLREFVQRRELALVQMDQSMDQDMPKDLQGT